VSATVAEPAVPARQRRRDFRLLWFGETTSLLGTNVGRIAMPLVAIAALHASTFQVGLLAAAGWLPWLAVGLPAGAWVDRLPCRPVLLTCDLVSLLAYASVPLVAWTGTLTVTHLLVVAIVAGAANVFFETAFGVYLTAVLTPAELTGANAKLQGSQSVTQVAGPSIGGLITQVAGAVAGMLADAVSFAVSAACLLGVRTREPERHPRPPTSLTADIAAGLRTVLADPYLRVLTVYGAAANLALTGYQAILVLFLIREVGLSAGVLGVVLAASSLGGVAGAALAGPIARRFGTARGLLLTNVGAAPFALLIPLTGPGPRLGFVIGGGFVLIGGIVAGNVIKGSWRQTYVPREVLGRITVSMQLLNYGTIPVGALLAGTLGTVLGIRPTIWTATAAVALAATILLVGPVRQSRDLPLPDPA
jgi:predicted MFS family arabinose efflux permease